MKLLITRPVVLAGDGGTRAFVPGLTVEVDAATAERILAQQAGIAAEPTAEAQAREKRGQGHLGCGAWGAGSVLRL